MHGRKLGTYLLSFLLVCATCARQASPEEPELYFPEGDGEELIYGAEYSLSDGLSEHVWSDERGEVSCGDICSGCGDTIPGCCDACSGCGDGIAGGHRRLVEGEPIAGFGGLQSGCRSGNCVKSHRLIRDFREFRLHHSSIDGRTFGSQQAISGTSWLNRPYYIGASLGGLFMTQGVQRNVRNDNDFIAVFHAGWDWDFFWGLEFRIARSGPEMANKTQPDVLRDDTLLITDLSLIYYPRGDTAVRPYFRAGVGWSDFDFPADDGNLVEASPFTVPLGIGVKWPIKRWLAGRLELVDHFTFGDSAVNFHQNFTLTLGLEFRFGAKPKSYWPWNPSGYLM